MASREKRYAITMAIRTACFVSMIFVTGPMRWVLLAGAVFLPYIAVVFANQANLRTAPSERIEPPAPPAAPQLTAGPSSTEVISGELAGDLAEDGEEPHGAYSPRSAEGAPSDRYVSHDRVA